MLEKYGLVLTFSQSGGITYALANPVNSYIMNCLFLYSQSLSTPKLWPRRGREGGGNMDVPAPDTASGCTYNIPGSCVFSSSKRKSGRGLGGISLPPMYINPINGIRERAKRGGMFPHLLFSLFFFSQRTRKQDAHFTCMTKVFITPFFISTKYKTHFCLFYSTTQIFEEGHMSSYSPSLLLSPLPTIIYFLHRTSVCAGNWD